MGMRVMLDRNGEGRVGLHGTSVPSGVSRVNECRLTFDAGVHMLGTQRVESSVALKTNRRCRGLHGWLQARIGAHE